MNSSINKASVCYIGYFKDNPVCFEAILHFPHPKVRNFKREHRLVVLPDYQGLNIGNTFASDIGEMYRQQGFRFINTSNNKSLFYQRTKDPRWAVTGKSRKVNHDGVLGQSKRLGQNFGSSKKYTYSYEYIGIKNK